MPTGCSFVIVHSRSITRTIRTCTLASSRLRLSSIQPAWLRLTSTEALSDREAPEVPTAEAGLRHLRSIIVVILFQSFLKRLFQYGKESTSNSTTWSEIELGSALAVRLGCVGGTMKAYTMPHEDVLSDANLRLT